MSRRLGLAITGGLLLLVAALYWGSMVPLAGTEGAPAGDSAAADRSRIPATVVDGDRAWPVAASPP